MDNLFDITGDGVWHSVDLGMDSVWVADHCVLRSACLDSTFHFGIKSDFPLSNNATNAWEFSGRLIYFPNRSFTVTVECHENRLAFNHPPHWLPSKCGQINDNQWEKYLDRSLC